MTVSLYKDYVQLAPRIISSEQTVKHIESNFRIRLWHATDTAELQEWKGFALVFEPGGDAMAWTSESDSYYGHFCEHAMSVANCETVLAALDDVDEKVGRPTYVFWNGKIAYDYSCPEAREAVEGLEASLAHYPCLDDSRMSELEYDYAIDRLESDYTFPEGVEPSDILQALHDAGESDCDDCSCWDVQKVVEKMDYRQCADCDEWIPSSSLVPILCLDCVALSGECSECSGTVADSFRGFCSGLAQELANNLECQCDSGKRHTDAMPSPRIEVPGQLELFEMVA
ncbi:hypothetical protein [Kitasatospora sp. NPDC056184]|uniref:hypothetical protein n=1 Tax=Kitasatospora sp. NPDC056184 TaxID=3345738 RepID=UPI0035D80BC3